MARIILIGLGTLIVLVLAWTIISGLLHALMLGFWFLIAVLVGFGLYRAISWSKRGSRGA
ncbi:MAG: hypothetical protein M0030_01170 [Actinomycetota bacterium]|jgi:hypothetical protein|nr:hypothetical protein [Actinomycetota bacterium]